MQRTEGIHQPNLINRLTFRFAQSGRAEYERPSPSPMSAARGPCLARIASSLHHTLEA